MRLFITLSVLFLAAAIEATATPLLPPINDPEILIDSDCCSTPISSGINSVVLTGAQTVTYDFFNDTSNMITSFNFATKINSGLSDQAAASFTCADPGGYFLNCSAQYMPSGFFVCNGSQCNLQYLFSGVNPTDDDETLEPEIGEQEGIPPGGHFKITLAGWTSGATASTGEQLYSGLPMLHNDFTQSPEPAVAFTVGTGLLVLAAMLRRKRIAR